MTSNLTTTTSLSPSMILTQEQDDIIRAVRELTISLMIDALAGTGKTKTLELAAREIAVAALALAFNVKIKKELEGRLPPNFQCMTLNGLGHKAWAKAIGKFPKVEDKKLGTLVTEFCKQMGRDTSPDEWDQLRRLVTAAMQAGLVPSTFPHKGLVPDSEESWQDLWEDSVQAPGWMVDAARDILTASVKQSFAGTISFDDQIYMSCQPAGTLVKAKVGSLVIDLPIEQIKEGDKVIAFDRQRGEITSLVTYGPGSTAGSLVERVGTRLYTGSLSHVYVGEKETRATHDHKWLVRFKPFLRRQELYFTYLMYREGSFRIGQTQTLSKWPSGEDAFGFSKRCYGERAEKGWLLDIHYSLQEAKAQEAILVAQYGITDTCFESDIGKEVHAAQRKLPSLADRAARLLRDFGRYPEFPFWTPNCTRSFESNFVVNTCNLISELMDLPVFTGSNMPSWESFIVAPRQVTDLQVYSMDIARHHTYIADGIITHNCMFNGIFPRFPVVLVDEAQDLSPLNHIQLKRCATDRLIVCGDPRQAIYAFRGADSLSMTNMAKLRTEWKHLTLSTTFRCPKQVVSRQWHHAPAYRAHEGNPEGKVVSLMGREWKWADVEFLAQGRDIFILCRNNAPLLSMAFKLLRSQVGVAMLGRDIGKNLVSLSKKIMPQADLDSVSCAQAIQTWCERECGLAKANGKESKVEGIMDRAECLQAVLEGSGVENAGGLRRALESLFAKDHAKVTLATGHRSKGLERPVVIHLDPWRVPSKFAKLAEAAGNPAPMRQEVNLKYVIETRAQDTLIEACIQDFSLAEA